MASTHSRNSIRRAVAVLVVLLIGIGGSGYTHVNDKDGRKLKTEGAQIYANDDQSSGVVYTLEPGDEYQLLDVDEQWCRIRVEKDDVEGYALVIELDLDVDEILAALNETEDEAETVEAVIETAAEPTVEPTEEPTAEPTEEPIEEATEAPAGDAAQAPEDTATEEPTEEATEQPTAEPTADATEAPAEPDEGDEIEREYDATHTPAPEKRVGAVDADELNVYAQADESSDVVMTLERDDEVEILGEEGAFLLVSADEQQGYALAECIYELSHDEQAALKTMWGTAVVTASSLNVRKTGSTSASLLYKIKSGQRVMLRGVDGDWYCIETESGKGYVLGDHLTVNAITGTSYKQGAKGDDVKELQRRLIELKYLTGTADGSFGASTKTAVKAFQKDAGLTADGVVGTGTLNKLFALGEIKFDEEYTTLSYGDSGDAVLKLQRRLRELGYMTANATGMFGTATKSALVDFQKAAGLTADGAAGNATQVALYAANAPAKGANTISGTLKVGDKGTAVTELQKRLIELGYLTTSATGTYGEATKAAVKEFQQLAGLTADGVAGTATINALFATDAPTKVDTTTLKYGDKGDSVKALQKRLIELGYLTETANGTFGPATKAAVAEFQKAAGITADGVAGSATITALFSASAPRKADGTLKRGDRGDAVVTLQKRLRELGYLTDTADGIFGDTTEEAIKKFQKVVGLAADGVAGATTQAKLNASNAPENTAVILRQGSSGAAVKSLQKRLIELGYLGGSADGNFGTGTKSAVAAFQRKAGLDADGIAGPTTLAVLYDADAPSATPTDDTLEQGDSGDAVKALQKRLIELGYMNGTADGDFGSATKAAVKLFQKQAGLTVDGVAGPGTQSALFSSNAPKYDGKTSVDTDTSSTAAKIIATAKQYMGCTYVYGTSGPNTFDCSGFTCFVFKKYGYSLLRSAQQQGYDDNYERLTRSELKMGDIVCFNTISDNDLSDHVGIYISDGNFIHASSGGGCVMISNLDSGYYNRVFSWGRRILD